MERSINPLTQIKTSLWPNQGRDLPVDQHCIKNCVQSLKTAIASATRRQASHLLQNVSTGSEKDSSSTVSPAGGADVVE